jgi:hypothetical protein
MAPDIQPAPRPCNRAGCGRAATHWVGLKLRVDQRSMPADAFTGIAVCAFHRQTLVVDDVVCDDGWTQIVEGFTRLGKPPPSRHLTVLLFRPIDKEVHP